MYRQSVHGKYAQRRERKNSPMSDATFHQLDLSRQWSGVVHRRFGDHKSGHKAMAEIVRCGMRTVAGWFSGDSTPHLKHVLAMMQDDELLRELLLLAGRDDIADIPAALQKIRAAQEALKGLV
jgi:hypothetical protein